MAKCCLFGGDFNKTVCKIRYWPRVTLQYTNSLPTHQLRLWLDPHPICYTTMHGVAQLAVTAGTLYLYRTRNQDVILNCMSNFTELLNMIHSHGYRRDTIGWIQWLMMQKPRRMQYENRLFLRYFILNDIFSDRSVFLYPHFGELLDQYSTNHDNSPVSGKFPWKICTKLVSNKP